MIEEIRGKGVNRAKVICDECGRDEVVTCGYIRTNPSESKPNVGQVVKKIEGMKWAVVKGKHHCPACESKRKAKMAVKQQEKPAEVRAPTPKQKREIIGILELVYDDERKRYKDGESDKTVADAIGGGVLWGWVAQIREDLFGPDTRNQEIEAIRESIKALDMQITSLAVEITGMRDALGALQEAADGIKGKLDKVSA